jgi:ABC-type branched-subunit amino acid transport system ATPase component
MSAVPQFLDVKDVRKEYGAIKAVDGVSFKVGPGEIVGVIGPNGSGKTTLFNAILGQIRPTSAASPSAARTSPACRRSISHAGASAARSRRCRCSASCRCATT